MATDLDDAMSESDQNGTGSGRVASDGRTSKWCESLYMSGESRNHLGDVVNNIVNNVVHDYGTTSTSVALVAIVAIFALFLGHDIGSEYLNSNAIQKGVSDVARVPPPFTIPYARHAKFIGRTGILEQLRSLEDDQEHHRTALYGMIGVGKTSTAVQYAHDFHLRHPDAAVLWIDVATAGQFNISIRTAYYALEIRDRASEHDDALQSFRDFLADYRNGRWLLILDDLQDPASSGSTWPFQQIDLTSVPETLGCQVLATITDRNAVRYLGGYWGAPMRIDPFSVDEARKFFESQTSPDLLEPSSIDKICEALAHRSGAGSCLHESLRHTQRSTFRDVSAQ